MILQIYIFLAVGHGFLGSCAWVGWTAGVGLLIWVWDCVFDFCFFEFSVFSEIILEKCGFGVSRPPQSPQHLL